VAGSSLLVGHKLLLPAACIHGRIPELFSRPPEAVMLEDVKNYYGQVLKTSADLQTNACCTGESMPAHIATILADIAPQVTQRYYGCGLVVPSVLEGLRVLDLGCGAGRDVYILSKLVGESGEVVGVDMTREQLDVAEAHVDEQRQRFGYARSNVRFVEGQLEHLGSLDLGGQGFDLIVSNCVINLCQDKAKVLGDAWSLLRPGGEMYFSDVYADRRVPAQIASDPLLYSECLGGALYWNDLVTLAKQVGFSDPRLVSDSPITIDNAALQGLVGAIGFYSATYRLFRLDGLEPACEDYGQQVSYRGSVADQPDAFVLDKHHRFPVGVATPVCGNTWRMLRDTRFADHFDFSGDMTVHHGIFADCGSGIPFDPATTAESLGSCCC
jgi:SAM-dependent methyltransferase